MSGPPLLVIVGPTAAGKTDLSLALALALGGEIVSADSRQIYRRMDIGTAKATAAERALAPHHLIDVVDPDQTLTLTEYLAMAAAAIAGIRRRCHLPLLVGGTGQYVHALVEGWSVPAVPPRPELRSELEAEALVTGAPALHARLAALDPIAAARIDYRNLRRVVRALEVCLVTGQPISTLQAKHAPPDRILQIGVGRPRPELYARIDRRIDGMLEAGLVEEVRGLAAAGCSWDTPAMTGLGYRQIGQYLRGEIALDLAVQLMRRATRRFVHQQSTWFRPADPAIHWINPREEPAEQTLAKVLAWLHVGNASD